MAGRAGPQLSLDSLNRRTSVSDQEVSFVSKKYQWMMDKDTQNFKTRTDALLFCSRHRHQIPVAQNYCQRLIFPRIIASLWLAVGTSDDRDFAFEKNASRNSIDYVCG